MKLIKNIICVYYTQLKYRERVVYMEHITGEEFEKRFKEAQEKTQEKTQEGKIKVQHYERQVKALVVRFRDGEFLTYGAGVMGKPVYLSEIQEFIDWLVKVELIPEANIHSIDISLDEELLLKKSEHIRPKLHRVTSED